MGGNPWVVVRACDLQWLVIFCGQLDEFIFGYKQGAKADGIMDVPTTIIAKVNDNGVGG